MTGFEVGSTGSILNFEGTKYEGLEVKVDEAPLGLLLDIMADYGKLTAGDLDVAAAARVLASLITQFAGVLEEWNATRRGVPVPPTLDGLRSLGPEFAMDIVRAWLTGTTSADDDLGKRLALWRDLAGGTDSSGRPVERPAELVTAEVVIGLCDRWHKTPDEIRAMGAGALRMLDVYRLGHRDEDEEGGE